MLFVIQSPKLNHVTRHFPVLPSLVPALSPPWPFPPLTIYSAIYPMGWKQGCVVHPPQHPLPGRGQPTVGAQRIFAEQGAKSAYSVQSQQPLPSIPSSLQFLFSSPTPISAPLHFCSWPFCAHRGERTQIRPGRPLSAWCSWPAFTMAAFSLLGLSPVFAAHSLPPPSSVHAHTRSPLPPAPPPPRQLPPLQPRGVTAGHLHLPGR